MEVNQETRSAILLLIRACKTSQIRATCLNSAIRTIMNLSSEARAHLTPAQIQEAIEADRICAEQSVDQQAYALEEAIAGHSDFVAPLKSYALSLLVKDKASASQAES